MSSYRIQCATYNGKLAKGRTHSLASGEPSDDLSAWLAPTLEDGGDEAPDFVAVGFQEMIPLHLALAGFTKTALDLHDDELRSAIEERYSTSSAGRKKRSTPDGERYSLVARRAIGGIALLLYAREASVAARLRDVQVATVGCGVFGLMGNKGAVGIRVVLDEKDGGETSSWTFVTAHLAAHQNKNKERARDWRAIVERLVFEGAEGQKQMFDTGHVFFFGDLNYRISLTTPKKLPLHLLKHGINSLTPSDPSTYASLLAYDQLRQERSANRSLHHLREGDITFPPTYKFKPGTRDEYKNFKKRVPGWCDRVLYASAAEDEAEVLSYKSVMDFTRSDHKPVAALVSIPASSATRRLPYRSPYSIDSSWRLKQTIGLVLDRFVGILWCLIMLAGFNKDARLGIVNIALATLGAYYRRALL
ncbi:Skeletal muscle/kidney enriched inositol 5-phosphatase [Rhodotorula toruloides ATCC 204091]|uniref:Skeletal muscle/kidney enriched inositol 5-phosphatase n=1 Tax=Rhodotorula toruloides TaxID=5286 RepID=A0A0K3CI24_RHOTO|nr:Skeletal muscle/kidney enriched inositol 5-phosphatase [Rhodotorula toruloides ATCC 204091]KAK4332713.1 Phosphatidylinositol 4,5-bisphosphate 5-phosphatase INP51 [Rhodotorula toruloides]PRQ73978.1 skeletal muscle/kidney enriched inositol 5-phosphatase [Rhodotorula toruloides]